ncbi:flagellar protein FliT [Pseudomonas sp. TE3786]
MTKSTVVNPMLQQIESTRIALVEAFAQEDWERIGALDSTCREQVSAAMAASADIEEALREQMEALVEVYRQLTAACVRKREAVGEELTLLVKSNQSAKIYQMFG